MTNPLYDALLAPAADDDGVFMRLPDGSQISYRQFHDDVARAANVMSEAGLAPGDRLAMQVEKSPAALTIYGACLMSGVIFLPLNMAYTAQEIGYFLADATPGLFVCDPHMLDELQPVTATAKASCLTLDAQGHGTFRDRADAMKPHFQPAERTGGDVAALLYTSGTTGRSKGAMLTHDNLLSNARVLCDLWRITEDDTLLHALPIFHAHGLFVAINTTLLAKAKLLFLPGFAIDPVIAALPKATTMMGVPTFYTRLLDDPRFNSDLVSNIRLFVSGSAPLLAETHEAFEARTGHRILERYGMTETSMNTSNPYDGERRAGTVGFPLPGVDLRITDGEGSAALPDGDIGMVEVRGPNVFKGYWNMPEKTSEDLRRDGFLITGDLGRIDENGYLHIVGRNKDLVISGGYNVYPKEVELVIDEELWVKESAVFGVPHHDFGEAVVAVTVTEAGRASDTDGLGRRMKARLASYKRPKAIFEVAELPRNAMGKVQKNILRDGYAGLFDKPVGKMG
ncbi:malonyl-CoA synthase [Ahrensia sp. R2A130]|uniref:malonate--CoA ligase n=1 Tax=Ahrensia sp. R2A130 TaxID=744979 RepID=UPI0001E0E110|nr:malonyl-CoA synthase [Ahrensia sp. R2A130]EFL87551.1 long-chain-fatty-acid--CoA ligase [Ahrensia sp. R2A130]